MIRGEFGRHDNDWIQQRSCSDQSILLRHLRYVTLRCSCWQKDRIDETYILKTSHPPSASGHPPTLPVPQPTSTESLEIVSAVEKKKVGDATCKNAKMLHGSPWNNVKVVSGFEACLYSLAESYR
jgi:hypothetical protein